jgi:hypothetical protein
MIDPLTNLSLVITNPEPKTNQDRLGLIKALCEKITGTPIAYCQKLKIDQRTNELDGNVYGANVNYFIKSVLSKKNVHDYDLAALFLLVRFARFPVPDKIQKDSSGMVKNVAYTGDMTASDFLKNIYTRTDSFRDLIFKPAGAEWNDIRSFFNDRITFYKNIRMSNEALGIRDPKSPNSTVMPPPLFINIDDFTRALNAMCLAEILKDDMYISLKCD